MKILYIASAKIPSRTANSIQVMKMCQGFKQNAVDITLLVPKDKENINANDVFNFYGIKHSFEISGIPINSYVGKRTLFAYQAVRYVKDRKADVIYARNLQVAIWASCYKTPFVLELHQPPVSLVERLSLRIAVNSKYLKYLVAITDSLKKWYINRGIPRGKIIVLPDAVDIERFPQPVYFHKKPIREIKIGYAGHLYKGRGIDLIFKLAETLSEIEFRIIGGNQKDIKFWIDYAKEKRIKNVILVGFIPNSRLCEELGKIDIFLMPHQKVVIGSGKRGNIAEFTSPMKMFEYMATGKPIIASDLPVLKEVLRDRENCMLVPCDDVLKWREAVEFLVKNVDFAIEIGKKARQEAEEKYAWDIRAKSILSLVKDN